jgi:hypothetical protein
MNKGRMENMSDDPLLREQIMSQQHSDNTVDIVVGGSGGHSNAGASDGWKWCIPLGISANHYIVTYFHPRNRKIYCTHTT